MAKSEVLPGPNRCIHTNLACRSDDKLVVCKYFNDAVTFKTSLYPDHEIDPASAGVRQIHCPAVFKGNTGLAIIEILVGDETESFALIALENLR